MNIYSKDAVANLTELIDSMELQLSIICIKRLEDME